MKRQPRTWPHLKGWLTGWVKQRRFGRGYKGFKKGEIVVREVELEIAAMLGVQYVIGIGSHHFAGCWLTSIHIRHLCESKISEYGQDLLPVAVSILQTADIHVSSTCFALAAINNCIRANITDPRAGMCERLCESGRATIVTCR